MIKTALLATLTIFSINLAYGQIQISMSNMPVLNDTLRSSAVNPLASLNYSMTGNNITWDFTNLVPMSQTVDTYKNAISVNPLYALSFSGAYGHQASPDDFFGQQLPVQLPNFYLFFQQRTTAPQRFVLRGFGGELMGTPVPAAFSDEDEWYYLPMQNGDNKMSTYKMNITAAGNTIKIEGTRNTVVDGWGTIKTPHFPAGVPCLRLRSVADEIDTIIFGGNMIPTARKVIDYKWLTNVAGEHYPVLWVTTNEIASVETVSSVRFKDHYRPELGIENVAISFEELKAFPNPINGVATVQIPEKWKYYLVEIFDVQGRILTVLKNSNEIDLSASCAGEYFVRVTSGQSLGFVKITKR